MIINQTSLEGIYRSFSTIFAEAFEGAKSLCPQVAMESPSVGRATDYKWLGAFPMLREWLGDRVIRDLTGFTYEIVNKNFEATVEVDRNDIEDDQIGIYRPMIQGLAQAAKQHPDILVFDLLKAGFETPCFDGRPFFDDAHPVGATTASNLGEGTSTPWFLLDLSRPVKPIILQVRSRPEFVAMDKPSDHDAFMRRKYIYGVEDRKNVGFGLWQMAHGSRLPLDASSYASARATMMGLKNEEGAPLGIVPTHLVVPPTLEAAGRAILMNQFDSGGGSNEWFGTAELIVSPWLA